MDVISACNVITDLEKTTYTFYDRRRHKRQQHMRRRSKLDYDELWASILIKTDIFCTSRDFLGLFPRIIFVSGFRKNVEVHTVTGRWGNPWPTDVGPWGGRPKGHRVDLNVFPKSRHKKYPEKHLWNRKVLEVHNWIYPTYWQNVFLIDGILSLSNKSLLQKGVYLASIWAI